MTILIDLLGMGVDVGRHLRLQGDREHLPRSLAHDLIEHRTARLVGPTAPPSERRRKLVEMWDEILRTLSDTISGVDLPHPTPDEAETLRASVLKRYEDALDALVCGWVGVQCLDVLCTAYGDETAAIRTP